MPLHVSSTMFSSSGGQNCIVQHLVSGYLFHVTCSAEDGCLELEEWNNYW